MKKNINKDLLDKYFSDKDVNTVVARFGEYDFDNCIICSCIKATRTGEDEVDLVGGLCRTKVKNGVVYVVEFWGIDDIQYEEWCYDLENNPDFDEAYVTDETLDCGYFHDEVCFSSKHNCFCWCYNVVSQDFIDHSIKTPVGSWKMFMKHLNDNRVI